MSNKLTKQQKEELNRLIEKRRNVIKEIAGVLNSYSMENDSDTPDFILAEYLMGCFDAFNRGVLKRSKWYSHHCTILGCNHGKDKR